MSKFVSLWVTGSLAVAFWGRGGVCTGVCLSGWVFSCYPEEGMRTASFCFSSSWICFWPADGLESDRKLGETSSQNPTQRDSVVSDGTLARESHQQSPPVSPLHVSPNNRGGKERVLWYQCFFNSGEENQRGKQHTEHLGRTVETLGSTPTVNKHSNQHYHC